MLVMNGKHYISDKEVRKYFPYGPDWFRKARYEKKNVPFIRFGRKVLYCVEEVEDWFNKNAIVHSNYDNK